MSVTKNTISTPLFYIYIYIERESERVFFLDYYLFVFGG